MHIVFVTISYGYPTAAKAASKQNVDTAPDERDAIWKADTGKTLPELLAER